MAQCKGTTKSGSRCKLDAQPGSGYCHLHAPIRKKGSAREEPGSEPREREDLFLLILAGATVAGLFLMMKALGRLIPRL